MTELYHSRELQRCMTLLAGASRTHRSKIHRHVASLLAFLPPSNSTLLQHQPNILLYNSNVATISRMPKAARRQSGPNSVTACSKPYPTIKSGSTATEDSAAVPQLPISPKPRPPKPSKQKRPRPNPSQRKRLQPLTSPTPSSTSNSRTTMPSTILAARSVSRQTHYSAKTMASLRMAFQASLRRTGSQNHTRRNNFAMIAERAHGLWTLS